MRLFRKSTYTEQLEGADETTLADVAKEILAAPVLGEAEVLAAVRKSGGGQGAEVAAAACVRALDAIREAFGGSLPEAVRKAVRADLGIPERPKLRVVPAPAPVEKSTPMSPEELERAWEEIAKYEQRENDRHAETDLQRVADQIRKADHSLTKEQAYVAALEQRPDLYERVQRNNLRKAGQLNDLPADPANARARAAASRLDTAAADLRKGDPSLTEAQSIAKALELNPELYG